MESVYDTSQWIEQFITRLKMEPAMLVKMEPFWNSENSASDDPALCKAKTHFCLMGNIHPPWFARYTTTQVEEKCKEIIVNAGSGGGFFGFLLEEV